MRLHLWLNAHFVCILRLVNANRIPHYRRVLNAKLIERIERNPKYSLRAFARQLGIESSALSQILSGRRSLSEKLASELFDQLDLSPSEQEEFLDSLAEAKVAQGFKRIAPETKKRLARLRSEVRSPKSRELSMELFRVIADWYHYAILELTNIPSFENRPEWIATRLGISVPEAIGAIERLKELELLQEVDGRLKKTNTYVDTSNRNITGPALKRRQRQITEKSLHSLETDSITIRNHSARTVAIDPSKIFEAKERIEKFMIELTDFLGSTNPKNVYELSVQLFPLETKGVQNE